MSLRRQFEAAAEAAARAGYPDPAGLFRMTPRQIEWSLQAFAARQDRRQKQLDELAWLAGYYAALGVNAPGKFPRRPESLRRPPARMTDAAMKQVFVNLAMGQNGGKYERIGNP